ncbi:hypothetical protein [Staphylococcus argenteus]|uniref:hypothetical protein n=1 Tax=Staphylococcus argenteus TaxID=985002 RepID=UPI000BA68C39|nr:hypothetical protein [Staphylococcus argenteus]PAK71954.1 hypothetical protein B8W95_12330 [Staphylococcus pasteuri]HBO6125127.1 hypothetical protein [Pseudomonas aeruginosa]GJF45448.1 hypothetical protein SA19061_25380 [Staphylococcus argenteus]GJF94471.1 hypothetical protein SASC210_25550 [Staphylococcus argenteus]GJF99777.1 hypothetical protein SASC253_25750 [Staphylococcus argenteus]
MVDFDYKQESLDALAQMDEATREELLDWCKTNFDTVKNINKQTMTSYGLKHLFEKDERTESSYVSNEEFRGAMITSRFKHTNERNMHFNISKKSENELRKRIFGY